MIITAQHAAPILILAGFAAPILILAGFAAWAARGRIRTAILRARWAWRCRGKPVLREIDPLDEWERAELITIGRGLKGKPARTERSRT
jgi:hypothetical protein